MAELDTDNMLLIVVGAELKAEIADRPLAYRMQKAVADWLSQRTHFGQPAEEDIDLAPVVLTDIWYLNNEDLHDLPLICIGGPGVNAVASYLQPRLPTALHIEEQLVIQLDVEFHDLRASIWGMNHQHTAGAVELFEKRYLFPFLTAAIAPE